jgi:hypothetical protein
LVALINGNFDDSEATGDLWVVAGYVGYANQWDYFERLWADALTRHGVPYFHMREMNRSSGPFAKWLPPQDHVEEVRAFFKDLVAAIRDSHLYMISSAVWIRDLDRFNQETGLSLQAYPLAAYGCMSCAAIKYENLPITAVFDRADKVKSKLETARKYADSDQIFPGLCDYIATVPLQEPLSNRDVPGLQAADFIAWEVRKAHFGMKEWQLSERQVSDRWSQWEHFLEWTRQMTGADPVLRKSLDALITESPVKSFGTTSS